MEWEKLVGWAEKETGVTWPEALGRHEDWMRDAVAYAAVRHGGWRLSEVVGQIAGLKYPAAAQGVRRIEARPASGSSVGSGSKCQLFRCDSIVRVQPANPRRGPAGDARAMPEGRR